MVQFQGRPRVRLIFGLRWIGSFLITANNEFRGSPSHPYLERNSSEILALGELLNELNSHFVSNLQSKKLPDGHHLGRSGTRRSPEDFRSASAGEANHGEWQHRALPDSVAG
jgi:hypothetical protein